MELARPLRSKAMDAKLHWEKVYGSKAPEAVSWYQPHLETSLALIEPNAPGRSSAIIDIGGGESTLVDDLLLRGYKNLTVLDVSQTALDATRKRLGHESERVHWIAGDITQIDLKPRAYDLWHDRAVFHFLTTRELRAAYVRQVERALKPGGHVVAATFGPAGPTRCSGLEAARYDAESLLHEFGSHFVMLQNFTELHQTPFGTTQQFLWNSLRMQG